MKHTLLFTGHMIDAPNRASPRFPAQLEQAARNAIYDFVRYEQTVRKGELCGIASGGCGGDILFHEVCTTLGIPTTVYLAMPAPEFKEASVAFAGDVWESRFHDLIRIRPVIVLPENSGQLDQNVYERTNQLMLKDALANGGQNMTLLALWDGRSGDGKGGTEGMISIATKENANLKVIYMNQLEV